MNATIIILFGAIVALILAGVEYYRAKRKASAVDDFLAEKSADFARERHSLETMRDELTAEAERLKMDTSTLVRATYFTSESDLLKYSDDKRLTKAVKKALCIQLADSIMKIAEPRKVKLEDGREMYALHFRVKEEE